MAKIQIGQKVMLAVPHSKVPATVLEGPKNGMVLVTVPSGDLRVVTASGSSGCWLERPNGTLLYGSSIVGTHWFHRHRQMDRALEG